MRTLLTVINDGNATALLDTALLAARKFDGRIIGINALASEYAALLGGESAFAVPPDIFHALEQEGEERRVDARSLFEQFMRRHDVSITNDETAPAHGASAEWREEHGSSHDVVGMLGRVYDLILVERPTRANSALALATLENTLFESGRPVLMTPPQALATFGTRITIAWNASTETARTVAMSMAYLAQAESVEVLAVEGAIQPGPSGDEMASNLRRRGIKATYRLLPAASGRSAGEMFLTEAKANGSDLLLKGAYTQSRLRQMIFGGTTRYVIMNAELPVILAH